MSEIVVAVLVPPIHSKSPKPNVFPIAKAINNLKSNGILTVFGFSITTQNNTVWINGKTIKENDLYQYLVEYCKIYKEEIQNDKETKIKSSLSFLKNKAKTLEDIYNNSKFIINDEVNFNEDDIKLIDDKAKKIISEFIKELSSISNINRENLEPLVNNLIKINDTNFKGVGQPLRIILTGSKFGPGLYDIVMALGKEEVLNRLAKIIS